MILSESDKAALDYPIRAALTGPHRTLAVGDSLARRYPPDISPLSAVYEESARGYEALASLIPAEGRVALFTPEVVIVPNPELATELAALMVQMILLGPLPDAPQAEAEIVMLGASDVPEMLSLVELTRPGPFGVRTHELGTYIGIRGANGELAAMAGERLHFDGFTEVSAVCVHPDHRGKGYARILVRKVMETITLRGEVPFLHTYAENAPAIALYERLGFTNRGHLHLTVLRHA